MTHVLGSIASKKFIRIWMIGVFMGFQSNYYDNFINAEVSEDKDLYGENAEDEAPADLLCDEVCQQKNRPSCMERRRILGIDVADRFVLVEATIGQDVKLDCHYCDENGNTKRRRWFRIERFHESPTASEVTQDLSLPENERKFLIDEFHRLVFRNFTESDGAIYYCQDFLRGSSPKFNFIVDVISIQTEVSIKEGNSKDFKRYFQEIAEPINKKLSKKYSGILSLIQRESEDELNFSVSYDWAPWGGCGKCRNKIGIKLRYGKCRLVVPSLKAVSTTEITKRGPLRGMKFGIEFSCHSMILNKFLDKELCREVSLISDYVEKEECICSWSLEQNGKELPQIEMGQMEIQDILMFVGEDVTLKCPSIENSTFLEEVGMDDAFWEKDGIMLNPSSSKQLYRNYIYLKSLQIEDTGTYTCSFGKTFSAIYKLNVTKLIQEPQHVDLNVLGIYILFHFVIVLLFWCFSIILIGRIQRLMASRRYKSYQELEDIRTSDIEV